MEMTLSISHNCPIRQYLTVMLLYVHAYNTMAVWTWKGNHQSYMYFSMHKNLYRYFVTIEAVDIVGLSTIVCPDVNFVVDNTRPQFIYVNRTCFTRTVSDLEEQLSWDIQALSGIVAIRYNISNMDLDNPQDFVPFPDPVESNQLNYNIQPLLPDHSGAVFLTLQAESRVGLTNTYNIRADTIC